MYGKFFSSTFTGSMMASGPEVFSVWGYVIAHVVKSEVELNPRLLAALIGSTPEKMREAIDKLCSPDPESRSKEEEGRRLVRLGEFTYRVVNHDKYRSLRNEDERREYNREAKRKERCQAMSNDVKRNVNDISEMSAVSAHTDTDTDTDTSIQKKSTSFVATNEKTSFIAEEGRFVVADKKMKLWLEAYPAVSIKTELSKAAAWLLANPKNKKSNYDRFLASWLSRAQDKAPAQGGGRVQPEQPYETPWQKANRERIYRMTGGLMGAPQKAVKRQTNDFIDADSRDVGDE